MPYAKRWHWLQDATGEDTIRGVARELGVTHTTVNRWLRSEAGIPMLKLGDVVIKYRQDLMEALVVWGYLEDEDVPRVQWEALARYLPTDVLVGEVNRRTLEYLQSKPDDPLRKTRVGMMRRASGP